MSPTVSSAAGAESQLAQWTSSLEVSRGKHVSEKEHQTLEALCAICNELVWYARIQEAGKYRPNLLKGEALDREPVIGGGWRPREDGAWVRQRDKAVYGWRPHNCYRFICKNGHRLVGVTRASKKTRCRTCYEATLARERARKKVKPMSELHWE